MKRILIVIALLIIGAVLFSSCTAEEAIHATVDNTVAVSVVNPSENVTAVTVNNTILDPVNVNIQTINATNNIPYDVGIAEGIVAGHSPLTKLGFNAAVGTTAEDIWIGSNIYVFPTAGQRMQVVSTSASDNVTGVGIRTARIYYLDSSYAEHEEDVTLNGTSPVSTVAANIFRVNDFRALTVGTNYAAVGQIAIENLATTPVYRYIDVGYTRSRGSIYTVPAGMTLYVREINTGVSGLNANNMVRLTLKATYNELDNLLLTAGLFFMPFAELVCPNGDQFLHLDIPIKFPEKVDVKISGYTDSGSAMVEAAFRGWTE